MKLEASGSPECGCLCQVVGDWGVNKVVNYPIQNGDSGLRSASRGSQPIRSIIAEKHFWYSRSLPVLSPLCVGPIPFEDGSFLHRSYAQVMLEEHRFWFSLVLGEHVETTMCVSGEIRQCFVGQAI